MSCTRSAFQLNAPKLRLLCPQRGHDIGLQTDASCNAADLADSGISAQTCTRVGPASRRRRVKLALFDALPIASVKAHSQDVTCSMVEGAPNTQLRIQVDAQQTGAEQFADPSKSSMPTRLARAELIPLRHATVHSHGAAPVEPDIARA